MDKTEFKKLLFDIACCAVACDGNIDEREIQELQYIDKSTVYFEDIDLSKQLDNFVVDFRDNETETINLIIDNLKGATLSFVEELLVLEIVLRLVYADTRIDEKEIEFLKSIRSIFSISDELIKDRFGAIDFLVNSKRVLKAPDEKQERKDYGSVNITNLENMYHSVDKKKKKK